MSIDEQVATLYVVATPIGNLDDVSPRALQVLAAVHGILAEDTRHSGRLLGAHGIRTALQSLNEHNELHRIDSVLARLERGESLALVSDAGTPLISDPGYRLVRAVREQGYRVSPIPGPSAVLAALSVCGLPTDRFVFEGFLPARRAQRIERLERLRREPRTIVLFEAPHRIRALLADVETVFGEEREVALAKELTKIHEAVIAGSAGEVAGWLDADARRVRGEFVLVLRGAPEPQGGGLDAAGDDLDIERLLFALLDALPVKQAVAVAVAATGRSRNALYRVALERQRAKGHDR